MATVVKLEKCNVQSKDQEFFQFILDYVIPQENYPNGNSGLDDKYVRCLFTNENAPFKNFVRKEQSGNPTTVRYIELSYYPHGLFAKFIEETSPILVRGFDTRMMLVMQHKELNALRLGFLNYENKREAIILFREWFLKKYA